MDHNFRQLFSRNFARLEEYNICIRPLGTHNLTARPEDSWTYLSERSRNEKREGWDRDAALSELLLSYRTTPGSHGKTPAEDFLGRALRTNLALVNQDSEGNKDAGVSGIERGKDKVYFDARHGARTRVFEPGMKVFAEDFRDPRKTG